MGAISIIASCTKGGKLETINGAVYTVVGSSDGTQLVPASGSAATGSFNGWYDEQLDVLTFTLGWANIWTGTNKDAITSVSFFSPADKGANGPLHHTILFGNANATGSVNLALAGSIQLSVAEREAMYTGKCYYIIFTTNYPNGIIRGQLTATKSH